MDRKKRKEKNTVQIPECQQEIPSIHCNSIFNIENSSFSDFVCLAIRGRKTKSSRAGFDGFATVHSQPTTLLLVGRSPSSPADSTILLFILYNSIFSRSASQDGEKKNRLGAN